MCVSQMAPYSLFSALLLTRAHWALVKRSALHYIGNRVPFVTYSKYVFYMSLKQSWHRGRDKAVIDEECNLKAEPIIMIITMGLESSALSSLSLCPSYEDPIMLCVCLVLTFIAPRPSTFPQVSPNI